jgi:hypothetical protein
MKVDPVKLASALKAFKPASDADFPGSYLWRRGNESAPEFNAAKPKAPTVAALPKIAVAKPVAIIKIKPPKVGNIGKVPKIRI